MSEQTYAIYTYEVKPRGNMKLQFAGSDDLKFDMNDTPEEKAHLIINHVMTHRLTVIGKKRKQDVPLIVKELHRHGDVFAFVLCNERDMTYYEGKQKESIVTHPGCYIVVDNRRGVCQIAIEKDDAFDMESNQAVKYLSRSFNDRLHDYGFEIVIKHKFSAESFTKQIKERLFVRRDVVTRIVWDFPNTKRVVGIDATEEQRQWLTSIVNTAVTAKALSGKLTLVGSKQNPLEADSEYNQQIGLMIMLSAQNGYNITYHFADSEKMSFKHASHAFMTIKEELIRDFMQGVSLHGDGVVGEESPEPTFELIWRLDDIRREIVTYNHEDIIRTDEYC